MKNIIVTGGAGFIGSHVVDLLSIDENHKVIVVDSLLGSNFKEVEKNPSAEYIYGDVSDFIQMQTIFEMYKPYKVVHLAANGNVPLSDTYSSVDFNSNTVGSYNIVNLCIRYEVEKLVYASTAAVYGEPVYTPIDEKHQTRPISWYGNSKFYGENLCHMAYTTYGLNFTAFRIFNTFGPRQPRYVLFDLIKKLGLDSTKLEVLGTGEQIRDYAYVSDTAKYFVEALSNDTANGQVYNIAGGNPISIKELVKIITNVYQIDPVITYTGQSWKGDIMNLTADITKLVRDFGFEPKVNVADGVERTIKWFFDNKDRIQ